MCCSTYSEPNIYLSAQTLVYKIYFWVSYCRPWFLWPETKKLVIPFLRIYLFASLLSMHCVSPHWRSHKLHRISTLKPNIILLWLPPWPQTIVENGSSIQGRSQDGANIEELSISPRKNISGTYLIYRLFARGRATSNGVGGRYDEILEFKGEQIKFFEKEKEKYEKEKKKERKREIWEKEKYEYV
jgi:hypothetical protein